MFILPWMMKFSIAGKKFGLPPKQVYNFYDTFWDNEVFFNNNIE